MKNKEIQIYHNSLPLMQMWQEDSGLYLFVTKRSGVYEFEFPDGYKANFLVDLDKTKKGQKEWTVYKYMGISNPSIQKKEGK